MPKATQGRPYTVVTGDNLTKIAKQAYGDPKKWRLLWKANQSTLRSGDANLIFPGEVIQIPADPLKAETLGLTNSGGILAGKGKDEFTLLIGDVEMPIQSARAIRTMDTVADGWSVDIAWDPSSREKLSVIRPYNYADAKVYVGGQLVISGYLYIVGTELSPEGSIMNLQGFSYTADMIDSVITPPYEKKKVTLSQRATELIEPLGLNVTFNADEGDVFSRVTATPEETIFGHLNKLANQRKVLISSDVRGGVVFYQADPGKSVGVIEEETQLYQALKVTFDGRKRFNAYRVIGPTPKRRSGNAIEATAKDDNVPKSRFTVLKADDATAGNIQDMADWNRSKQVAETLDISFPVSSWYAPDGSLWRENTVVTAVSPTIFVPDGFDFLIKSVEYLYQPEGVTAVLNLVPPQVYTGEPLEEPWI